MNRRHCRNRLAIASLALAALLGSTAATATAAPTFGLELELDTLGLPTVSRSDERVDYTLKVSNTADPISGAPSVGDSLFCNGTAPPLGSHDGSWVNESTTDYSFEFQWVRNGEAITPWTPGVAGTTYTVQVADQEKALQCLVKGTNGAKSGSFVAASQPAVVVDPQPAVEPPKPSEPTENTRRPSITGSAQNAGEELTCTAPSAWTGSPSWTFKWIRNGVERPGAPGSFPAEGEVTETTATSSKFKIAASELVSKAVFQCMAIASNAGGSSIVESLNISTEFPAPEFVEGAGDALPRSDAGQPADVERGENNLIGSITLELELPGGLDTYAAKVFGSGWTCDTAPAFGAEHAKVVCSRSDLLLPGESYPPLTVVAALGADTPDPAVATATVFGGAPAVSATEDFPFAAEIPFGLKVFEAKVVDSVGADYTQAGGHGHSAFGHLELAKKRRLGPEHEENSTDTAHFAPIENPKQVFTDLPRGFVGNIDAIPQLCPSVDEVVTQSCPNGSQVGRAVLIFSGTGENRFPVYALEPEFGAPIQIAIPDPFGDVYVLTPRLRPDDNYAITLEAAPIPPLGLLEATVTLCDFGVKTGGAGFTCWKANEAGAYSKPFFTNPTRCGAPPVTRARLNSWPHPERFAEKSFTNEALTGCEQVKFEPTTKFQPTSQQADSPTGLKVELTMPTDGFEDPDRIAQANLKRAKVTLPEGMSVNATAGKGLAACTMDQIGFESKAGKIVPNNDPVACPDGSKIGSLEVDTPVIDETFKGDVYIAKQSDNPFGSLLALYIVIDSPKNGILVKLAGLVKPDPVTGQMVVTFNDNPEVPFSSVRLDFPQGPRSPLLNPPTCKDDYQIVSEMSAWNAVDPENPTAAEIVKQVSTFDITSGPNGGPCPTGALEAKMNAGTIDPVAGKTSPFVFRLTREDGSQRFTAVNVRTPKGLTAYLKGIPYCPQATLDAISEAAGTGQAQIDNPSCPAASQVGTAIAGAGAGPDPLFVDTGKAYLAGPYKGAPVSLALVAPAVAGPIDLGNVVVQTAILVNPETAEITAVSDPVPTILHGILLDLRDIRVSLDRPKFTLNPTSCEPSSVGADVKGEKGGSLSLSTRFQVAGCENLRFKRKLSIRLFGGTKRGDNPKLRTVLTAGEGEANIARAAVTIPRSEFLDQSHIRTICTRVQFAADACPKGSVYGFARAITPLLDDPVEGPVYLRSSNNKLPDLVIALRGPERQPIEAVAVGRVDSIKGQIRVTIENAPDVPVTKFILTQQGGKKGLLVNSRDVCASKNRATVRLTGHNGKVHNFRPVVTNSKCNQQRKGKRKQTGKK